MIARRLLSEALGSCLLTATVIGSGIMASRLAHGNDAVALLGNTLATASILYVLIVSLRPVSGAHFNPAVSMMFALRGAISIKVMLLYVMTQIAGCIIGAWIAHAMFDAPLLQTSGHVRAGPAQMLSEAAATFALVFAILGTERYKTHIVASVVALVIAAGYWWTASTSFANPAISIARSMSDTFAGIRPADVPGFILGQLAGAVLALGASNVLFGKKAEPAI